MHKYLATVIEQDIIYFRKVPDSAFMIGPIKETSTWSLNDEKVDILFALRPDAESTLIKFR